MKIKDLSGSVYGRLTVIGAAPVRLGKDKRVGWICRCTCGAEIVCIAKNLKSGATQSCGCIRVEMMRKKSTTHGGYGSKLYNVWRSMKARCHRETDPDYCYYGARGITVCDRWRESYSAFKDDVGATWKPGLTIDRIDNDGNYEPGNVKWSTMTEQALNRRPRGSVFPTRRNK